MNFVQSAPTAGKSVTLLPGLVDCLLIAEDQLGLFDLRLFKVQFWPLMRLAYVNIIARELGMFSETGRFLPPEPEVLQTLSMLGPRNPLIFPRRRQCVIVEGSALYQVDGEPQDIYTSAAEAELPAQTTEIVDLGRVRKSRRTKRGMVRLSGDAILRMVRLSARARAALLSRKLEQESASVRPALSKMDSLVSERFGVAMQSLPLAFGQVVHYLSTRFAWRRYFGSRRPDIVVLGVQRYGYEGLIRAAHEVGARVAECQHGIIHVGHVAYHFPGRQAVEDQPDWFLGFGPIWKNMAVLPSSTEFVSAGFAPIELARKEFKEKMSNRRRTIAVLTGDPFRGADIIQSIRSIRASFPDLSMVIRPHPSDVFDYRTAVKAATLPQIDVVAPSEPAYGLLAECEFAIGGCSTVLFEAMAMGCKTIAMPFGYRKFLEPLTVGSSLEIAGDFCDLPDAMRRCRKPGPMEDYFDPNPTPLLDVLNFVRASSGRRNSHASDSLERRETAS